MKFQLTPDILKSVDSSFHQDYDNSMEMYIAKYNGKIMNERAEPMYFDTEKKAKNFVKRFVYEIFWHGEHWQSCKTQIKKLTGYDVDYTGTTKILSSYGETSRFQLQENKKMFNDIADQLLEQKIIVIEKVSFTKNVRQK